MLGLVLSPWATPTMMAGHLYFSVFMTAYCIVGSFLSKRDHDQPPRMLESHGRGA